MRTTAGFSIPVIFVSLLIAGSSALAATARLDVSPSNNLPGMVFTVGIAIENGSSDVVNLNPECQLQIRTGEGEVCVAGHGGTKSVSLIRVGESSRVTSGGLVPFRLEAGESISLYVPLHRYEIGPWVEDARLTKPGHYRLSVVIDGYQNSIPVRIQTPEVEYIVEEPRGVDIDVWDRLREFIVPGDEGGLFAASTAFSSVSKFVHERAPESAYAPYVVGYDYRPYSKERALQRTISAIEEYPDVVVTEKNRLRAMTLVAEVLRNPSSSVDRESVKQFVRANLLDLDKSGDPEVTATAHQRYEAIKEVARERGFDF